jgi:hypothetical protein
VVSVDRYTMRFGIVLARMDVHSREEIGRGLLWNPVSEVVERISIDLSQADNTFWPPWRRMKNL